MRTRSRSRRSAKPRTRTTRKQINKVNRELADELGFKNPEEMTTKEANRYYFALWDHFVKLAKQGKLWKQ